MLWKQANKQRTDDHCDDHCDQYGNGMTPNGKSLGDALDSETI